MGGYWRNVAIGKAVKENRGSVDIDSYLWSWGRKNKGSTCRHVKKEREGRERERGGGDNYTHILHFQGCTGRTGGSNIHTSPLQNPKFSIDQFLTIHSQCYIRRVETSEIIFWCAGVDTSIAKLDIVDHQATIWIENVLRTIGRDELSIEGPRMGGYWRNIAIGKTVKENGGSVHIDRYL